MDEEIIGKLEILKNRIKKYYRKNLIIDHVSQTNIVPSENKWKFEWFTCPTNIPRTNVDPDTFPITAVIERVIQQESNYAISKIKENSKKVELDDGILKCITKEAVSLFNQQDVKCIILPRSLYAQVPIWNNELNPNELEKQRFLHLGVPKSVKVVIPPAGVEFNDIIISANTCNYFEFSASPDNDRLEVGYKKNNTGLIPFWVHSWCNYKSKDPSCNVTITM